MTHVYEDLGIKAEIFFESRRLIRSFCQQNSEKFLLAFIQESGCDTKLSELVFYLAWLGINDEFRNIIQLESRT